MDNLEARMHPVSELPPAPEAPWHNFENPVKAKEGFQTILAKVEEAV